MSMVVALVGPLPDAVTMALFTGDYVKMRPAGVKIARSEERRVGKECRSRCDWSSDVCSSDLYVDGRGAGGAAARRGDDGALHGRLRQDAAGWREDCEIGRASCRERV